MKSVSLSGGLSDEKARLVIEADLRGFTGERAQPIFATALQHSIHAALEKLSHACRLQIDVIQGEPKEFALVLSGEGELRSVTGDRLLDWSVRKEAGGLRFLVLRPKPGDKSATNLVFNLTAETELKDLPCTIVPLAFAATQPALFQGFVRVDADPGLDVEVANPSGVVPIDAKFLPEELRPKSALAGSPTLAFRFQGAAYALPVTLTPADPEARRVVLSGFRLTGQLSDQAAAFTLTATARIKNPQGATLDLLSGGVALTELATSPDWRLRFEKDRFVLAFDKAGEFPVKVQFNAAVRQAGGWNSIDFRVPPSALQSATFQGLAADTQFRFAGAAKPERQGDSFVSFLPANGQVQLSWKEAKREAEGKLFYSAEMLSQIVVSPGLMRQWAVLDGKVMQGELSRLTLQLRGQGEVTRVQGEQVLSWEVVPGPDATSRCLVVQFNQPQKEQFALVVQMQTPLGAFPAAFEPVEVRADGATRFAGYHRIVNEGAVRLEVVQASGLSQISPEQFPETATTKALFATQATQRFAYRFSGAAYQLRIQADNVLPELAVSELLLYHLGETELAIDGEMELDIRDAPLRELVLRVPKGYALARLTASGLSDYFLKEEAGESDAQLRLVYGQPISGRQVMQFRLERNKPLGDTNWVLPRIDLPKAKSVRGNVAVSADPGFRVTPTTTQNLTEIATAFFPRKVAGIQAAFRLSEPAWQATLKVERLPQSIQADVFHLFSIGEGIAYGSSVINYLISGAPVSSLRVELSDEYANLEFSGKDIRGWQKTTNRYEIQLHSPVSGAYTLLATYERPFKAKGETLTFTGARPLEVQSEQGHTIVVSAYQFQVKPANISAGLLALEPAEVPAEYRLFFDAPILAAYRYTSRPFNLQLVLSPLAQGETLSQVADRASLSTRVSKEGQVLTDARYFVKNRGTPHFRLALPPGTELWSATVNGATVVPVTDNKGNLIPLPQKADPNAVNVLDLKLASRSKNPARVTVAAPVVAAPVLLAEWKLEPDTGQRLVYRRGSLTPAGGITDVSGFAGMARLLGGPGRWVAWGQLALALALVVGAVGLWRWAAGEGVGRFGPRHVLGGVLGVLAFVIAVGLLVSVAGVAQAYRQTPTLGMTFVAPIQQAGSVLTAEVDNLPAETSALGSALPAWPALLALAVWTYAALTSRVWFKPAGVALGWTLAAWAALRCPNGAGWLLAVVVAFLIAHIAVPALRRLWQVPPRPKPTPPANGLAAAATALVLMLASLTASAGSTGHRPVPSGDSPDGKSGKVVLLAQASSAPPRAKVPLGGSPSGTGGSPILPISKDRRVAPLKEPPVAESVTQQIRVADEFVFATAKIRWTARKDQLLPLLYEPAVLTRIAFPTNTLKLVQSTVEAKRCDLLLAQADGPVEIEVQYQLQVAKKDGESGFALPTQFGLVNRVTLTVADLDVDVTGENAVSVQRENASAAKDTVASLVLAPVNGQRIAWKPRSRDTRREKAVFYAEMMQLYVPSAGVIEGEHLAQIRPAQGEIGELVFDVPGSATITDVSDSASQSKPAVTTAIDPTTGLPVAVTDADTIAGAEIDATTGLPLVKPSPRRVPAREPKPRASIVSAWRFDPDARKLRVTLNPPQSRPFALAIYSQVATGPLPFEQSVSLISVTNAAGQLGLLGIATGAEAQLDSATAQAFTPINLEDFPASMLQRLSGQIAGLTLRRAFRYSDVNATVALKASPVESDVRVESQQTLSLGEDRTVLAANLAVEITRAGIFRLSFVLPPALDVESITGPALSHWTELKTADGRVITLNLKGKTEGQQQLAINLAGPGARATNGWPVPKLLLREAGKQRGQLVIVPEQGMRLQVAARDGVTQLDPQKSGIRQKGVVAFRLLQEQWNLTLDLEQVAPWIQVTSLQHVTVNEAQVKVTANLQYQIENTGLKAFRVRLPTNSESVRFTGDQVADFLDAQGAIKDGMQEWEVKLHRRVIGSYLLQASYQVLLSEQARQADIRGVTAEGVNLQRGFLTVQSGGRLQLRADALPAALQPSEWQSIPRNLRQDVEAAPANYTYRLVEPAYDLPLQIERREAAKLLPARVNNITLTSAISDDGVMLTQVRMEMIPGDKRLLHLTLPDKAKFWFAFVNQNGVWPWLEKDQILIPLEQQSKPDQPIVVELFYNSQIGTPSGRALDLQLLGPKFDLPLENITWRVHLNEKWKLKDWTGTLQLSEDTAVAKPVALDVSSYLQSETTRNREQTKQAEQWLNAGNSLLQQGNPEQARRAFQNAYGLSQNDQAFNEDARVQLHNLKMQQALLGLNVRQSAVAGEAGGAAGKLREVRNRKGANYTQDEAKQIIDRNTADDNAALMKVAERLVQQQDAAVASPAAIRASIPEQGRLLTFRRAVQVDTWADMKIGLEASAVRATSAGGKMLLLAGLFVAALLLGWGSRLAFGKRP